MFNIGTFEQEFTFEQGRPEKILQFQWFSDNSPLSDHWQSYTEWFSDVEAAAKSALEITP